MQSLVVTAPRKRKGKGERNGVFIRFETVVEAGEMVQGSGAGDTPTLMLGTTCPLLKTTRMFVVASGTVAEHLVLLFNLQGQLAEYFQVWPLSLLTVDPPQICKNLTSEGGAKVQQPGTCLHETHLGSALGTAYGPLSPAKSDP